MDAAETLKAAAEAVTEQSRKNLEAVVASASAAAKGAEALGGEAAAWSRSFLETHAAAAKAVAAAKTPLEAFEVQTAFARGAFESYVAEMSKVGEMLAAACKDAAAPLNARASEAMAGLNGAR
jgi:phasin family protein